MRLQANWVVGVVVVCLWAGPAGAQNVSESLKLVPEDASAFALVNRVGVMLDWFDNLVKKQKFPFSFRELLRKELGFDKGLDEKGDLVLVIYLGAGQEQINVIGVPITDYKDFLQGLKPGEAKEGVREITLANGEKMLAASKGKYALLAKPEHSAMLKKVLAGGKNVVASTRPLHRWLADTSYSLVLTPRGFKEAQAEWRKGLDEVEKKLLPKEARFVLPLLDVLGEFLKTDEVTHLSVGARLDPAGDVAFRFKMLFKEGGAFAKGAGKVKAVAGGPLAGLPTGPYSVAFGGPAPGSLMKTLVGLKLQWIKATAANPDSEKIRELEKMSLELTQGVEGLSVRLGRGKEGEPLLVSLLGVFHVRDASTFLTHAEKTFKATGAMIEGLKSSLVSDIQVRKVKAGEHTALEIDARVGQGLEADQKKILNALFGAEGKVTVTLLAAGDGTVVVGYRPAAELVKMLSRPGGRGLADDPQTAKTIKLLPKDAQWVLLMHPQEVMELISRFQKGAGVKRFPDTPPVGIALRLSPAGADLEMVMPAALVEASLSTGPPMQEKGR